MNGNEGQKETIAVVPVRDDADSSIYGRNEQIGNMFIYVPDRVDRMGMRKHGKSQGQVSILFCCCSFIS